MRSLALVLLLTGAPLAAQTSLSEAPDPDFGGVTCAAFVGMDSLARLSALEGIEPVGGEIAGADPALARQWAAEVAAVCANHPDWPISRAATEALGGD